MHAEPVSADYNLPNAIEAGSPLSLDSIVNRLRGPDWFWTFIYEYYSHLRRDKSSEAAPPAPEANL